MQATGDVRTNDRERIRQLVGKRYHPFTTLGRGGMSRVYLAWDRKLDRRVAIKLLAADLSGSVEHRERFRRETLIATRLEHPHIVTCYDSVHRDDMAIAIMRYVPGSSLDDLTRAGRRLPWPQVLSWLTAIADALAFAHEHGVIHRDVKPANILIQDGDDRPFLTDFGVATLRTSEASRAEVVQRMGTPEFMAPEQVLGDWDADHRGDIYALGATAYLALSGRLPFEARSAIGYAAQQVGGKPLALALVAPEVPRRLARVIDRCLQREPRRRWPDARRLAEAFRRIQRCASRDYSARSAVDGGIRGARRAGSSVAANVMDSRIPVV